MYADTKYILIVRASGIIILYKSGILLVELADATKACMLPLHVKRSSRQHQCSGWQFSVPSTVFLVKTLGGV